MATNSQRAERAGTVFDRSFLPVAGFEFIVLSDTHYLLHPELQGGEWQSILQFPSRAERALQLAGALQADFVVHCGDVTHEYPETGEAVRSRRGAQAQFEQYGLRPYVAAGNMDIGDKPDPTSPPTGSRRKRWLAGKPSSGLPGSASMSTASMASS